MSDSEAFSPSEVRLAARRRQVAKLLSRGWSIAEIAAALEVSDETIRRDAVAVRKIFARDMGNRSSVMDFAEDAIRRSQDRERELWIMYEEAKGKKGEDGKLMPGEKNDIGTRLQIHRELRANVSHEMKILQSLGLLYRAPEKIALSMRLMSQVEALPDTVLTELASTTDMEAFTKLLRASVSADVLEGLPPGEEVEAEVEEQPLPEGE